MLGFVDAFCCPHADAFEKRANISREESYDAMLRCAKRTFWSHLIHKKTINLPRQARDKRRKS